MKKFKVAFFLSQNLDLNMKHIETKIDNLVQQNTVSPLKVHFLSPTLEAAPRKKLFKPRNEKRAASEWSD